MLVYVGGQLRLFRFLMPGTAHFFIFWGFLILFPDHFAGHHRRAGGLCRTQFCRCRCSDSFGPLALLQDLFAVFVMLAVGYGLYIRLVV